MRKYKSVFLLIFVTTLFILSLLLSAKHVSAIISPPPYQFDENCKWGEIDEICIAHDCKQYVSNQKYYLLEEDSSSDYKKYCRQISIKGLLFGIFKEYRLVWLFITYFSLNFIGLLAGYLLIKKRDLVVHWRFLRYVFLITVLGYLSIYSSGFGVYLLGDNIFSMSVVLLGIIFAANFILPTILIFLVNYFLSKRLYELTKKQSLVIGLIITLFSNPIVYSIIMSFIEYNLFFSGWI
ncbi:hypothetical protein JXA63_02170 [Candidatus Woesebacteria bacterium]|nr:hypothetical protein [Candidatus Woesebacteria bacterium]